MGCGCLIALAAALSPRFALFLVWIFTDRIPAAFDGNWLFPIIGFFLLPWTTLAWAIAWAPIAGIQGFGWAIVALGLVVDLSTHAAAAQSRRLERSGRS